MSVAIKLDRRAVAQLIDQDPEFKLELQRAVISEVVRNLFEKDVRKILEVGDKALLKQVADVVAEDGVILDKIQEQVESLLALRTTSGYWSKSIKVSAQTQQLIDEVATAAVSTVTAKASRQVTEGAQQAIEKFVEEISIDERIEKRTKRLLDEEVNRRVDAEVKRRLAAIAEGISS